MKSGIFRSHMVIVYSVGQCLLKACQDALLELRLDN